MKVLSAACVERREVIRVQREGASGRYAGGFLGAGLTVDVIS
jgi:hypothetical protein